MRRLFLIFLGTIFSFASFTQTSDTALSARGGSFWQTLSGPLFQMRYPTEWTPDQSGTMGTSFILFAPLESNTDKFKENINLNMANLGGSEAVTLEAFAKAAADQIDSYIDDSRILNRQIKTRNGVRYYELEFTGRQGGFQLHWKQQYWFKGPHVFILTFTAEQSTYNKALPLADRMLDTFEVL